MGDHSVHAYIRFSIVVVLLTLFFLLLFFVPFSIFVLKC